MPLMIFKKGVDYYNAQQKGQGKKFDIGIKNMFCALKKTATSGSFM